MSDANRTSVRFAKEASFRTQPATPVYKEVRFTSESVNYTPSTDTSSEINASRQVTDLILTGYEAGGDVAAEYSIENSDILMEGTFCNAWLRTPEIYNGASWEYGNAAAATRITAVSATSITVTATSTLAGSTANNATTVFLTNNLIRLSGFGDANDTIFVVSASAATSLTIAGGTVNAAPAATARVKVIGYQGASADIAATTVGGNALTSTTLNFTTLGLIVGQWVKISGEGGAFSFATPANNGYCRISAIAANRLSFDVVPTGWATDTGTGKTIRLYYGDTIRNGVTEFSYRMEKQYGLIAGTRYAYFRGMEVSSMTLTADTRAIVTQSFTFTGSDGIVPSVTRDSSAITESISAGTVLDSSNSIAMVLENGAAVGTPNYVSSFALTLDNNLRQKAAIGAPGAIGIGQGRSDITGTLGTYFGDESYLAKLLNNTASGVTVLFRDLAKLKGELWDVPRLKYSGGVPEVTGIDTDIFANLSWQAIKDITNNRDYTLMLCRFDYLA
jgi:hypothetical protein